MKCAMMTLAWMLLWPAAGAAQIEWRVSVKFILDANGNRASSGNLYADSQLQLQVDLGNAALDATGRGYRLELVEIVDLAGLGDVASIACGERDALDLAARTYPTVYAWRTDAINVYVTQASCAGACSYPTDTAEVIILGQGANPTSLLHEIGHYMDLCHTQGCACAACGEGTGVCNDAPGNDTIGDTLPDLGCWTQDEIALNSFGQLYANLALAQQVQVDAVFFNIMSYHAIRDRLTDDQMDRMTDTSNGPRWFVASGRTYFVDANGPGGWGTSQNPFDDVDLALSVAGPGDIVLLRAGTYAEPTAAVTEAAMLRASRGSATLR